MSQRESINEDVDAVRERRPVQTHPSQGPPFRPPKFGNGESVIMRTSKKVGKIIGCAGCAVVASMIVIAGGGALYLGGKLLSEGGLDAPGALERIFQDVPKKAKFLAPVDGKIPFEIYVSGDKNINALINGSNADHYNNQTGILTGSIPFDRTHGDDYSSAIAPLLKLLNAEDWTSSMDGDSLIMTPAQ